jgi:hypothetical protein
MEGDPEKQSSFLIGGQVVGKQQQQGINNDQRKRQLHKELSMNVTRRSVGLYQEYPLAAALLAGATVRYVEP